MKTKIVSLLLALAMLLSLLPVSAMAAVRDPEKAMVRVIVENTTYLTDDGAPWDGTLVDTWVEIDENSSIGSCLVAALDEYGYTQSGAEYGYVSEINGIREFDGSGMGGWMVTLNDWFINEGVDMFTVASGKLEPGDEVKIMYSNAGFGEDLGGTWSNNDKTVKDVQFSVGTLDQPFSADVYEYVLTLPAGTTGVILTPTATNKNFQVRAYDDAGEEYKRNDTIPVANGDLLVVICGDPEWPSMNNGEMGSGAEDVDPEVYLFEVVVEAADPDLFFTVDLTGLAGLTGQLYEGGIANYQFGETEPAFWDHSAAEGKTVEYAFAVSEYDQYILYMDFYLDSDIVGWNVNGTNYFVDDSAAHDDYWDLDNDSGVGYAFELTDEGGKEFVEFYLLLGATESYNTPGTWSVKPLALNEENLAVMDAIGMIDEEITLESGNAISSARALYNQLTDTNKDIVKHFGFLEVLEAAEETYNALLDDKAAADPVIAKINAIGAVTLDKETAIRDARIAYDALTDAQKAFVTNYQTLTAAEATLATLKQDQAAAEAVMEKINAIGTVTLDSEEAINAAWEAYNALTVAQKALVTNYNALTAAQEVLTQLKDDAAQAAADKAAADAVIAKIDAIGTVTLEDEAAITAARTAYDALTNAQKALVTNYETLTAAEAEFVKLQKDAADKAAADAVIEKIEAIGTVTLEDEAAIAAARAAYNALTDAQKALVTNYETLTAAEAELAVLKEAAAQAAADKAAADKVIEKISAIGTVTLESENAITVARTAYNALTDAQKALVTNYSALTTAEATLAELQEAAEQAAIDQAAANAVKEKIAAIGTVNIFSGKKVAAAKAAFDALTDTQKALVENASVLNAAVDTLKALYATAAATDHKKIYDATGKYIASLGTPSVGDTGGEWMIIDLLRAGQACPAGYYENVVKYVQAEINDKEQLHRAKGTDNSRMILALTAAGYDVTNVAGHNLLMGLTDMTYVQYQGINGPIWALIAFDSHNYEIPVGPNAAEQVTREKLIAYILDKQLADGGWALTGNTADADMTGMALQALAPYYKTNADVKTAVDEALALLSAKQNDMGGFGSIDGYSTESCAQIIVALTALGIDPETDSRFIKNGMSAVDAMCQLTTQNGGFAHIPGGNRNGMATEQGQYALAAYFRFISGQTALYDMNDVIIRSNNEGTGTVENTTDSKDNAHNATLDTPVDKLSDALLTEEEEKLVENGMNIYVGLSVEDISNSVSESDKQLVEKHLNGHAVGVYLDITLTKQLGESTPVKLTETAGAVTVTITVPDELRNTDSKMVRTYKIIRVHEGKADVLDASFDEKTGKLSFETDRFSTYTLVYTDTPVSDNPKTGDNAPLALAITVMLISLCSVFVIISRKKCI